MSKHFKDSEFACKHCGELKLSRELVALLELVRLKFNAPVTVNSGYRCPEHNEAVGGASSSQHLLGTAGDIIVSGVNPNDVADFIDDIYPNDYGLGRYNTFTHIDVRVNKARWDYR